MKGWRLVLISLFVAAGCGGGEATRDSRAPVSEAWRAQAEETCLKFLRFPGYPYANVKKRPDVLEQLDLHERRIAILTEASPDGGEYRRLVVKPAQRVAGAVRTARQRVRAGDSPEYAYIDFSRERDDFDEAYSFAAEDLGLHRCVEERLRTDELDSDFRRGANSRCGEAQRTIRHPKPSAPLRQFEKALEQFARLIDDLEKLKPPERTQRLWRGTLRGVRDYHREVVEGIEEMKGIARRGGPHALEDIDAVERRMELARRGVDRGFRMLNFNECANLF